MLALFFAARKQGLFLDKIYNSMAALTAVSFEQRLKQKRASMALKHLA